jgi:hypothetical protein
MRPIELSHMIALCHAAREPMLILGAPGIGKTHIPRGTADAMGIGFTGKRAPDMDVIDTRGKPTMGNMNAPWQRPPWLPEMDNGKVTEGIIFIDELPSAVPAVQVSLYELFERRPDGSRWLCDHPIPPGWLPVGSGNRLKDKAVVHRMPTPLISRLAIVELENATDDFIEWCVAGKAMNYEAVRKYSPGDDNFIEPEIIAFVKQFPSLTNNFNPEKIGDNEPYACQRSWQRFSNFLKVAKKNGLSFKPADSGPYISQEYCQSFIGKGAASDFLGWIELFNEVPTKEEILLNPSTAPVPEKPSFRYAVAAMLGRCASKNNIEQVLRYATRMPKTFEVIIVQTASSLNKEITTTRPFMSWAVKNKGVIL